MLIPEFKGYLETRKSKSTVEKYVAAARGFFGYLVASGKSPETMGPGALRDYVTWLRTSDGQGKVPSPATIQLYAAGAKSWLKFLSGSGVPVPQMADPDLPKVPKKMPVAMSREELARYSTLCLSADEPFGTACLILPYSGLRLDEMRNLRLSDVITKDVGPDDRRYIFRVRHGKGDKERLTPMFTGPDMAVSHAFDHYLTSVRPKWDGDLQIMKPERWVFPTPSRVYWRSAVNRNTIEKMLADWRVPTGVPTLHPHGARVQFATALLSVGHLYDPPIDPLEVARYLGHARGLDTLQDHYAGCRLSDAQSWMGVVARPEQADYAAAVRKSRVG